MLERARQLCEDGELLEVQASEFLLREARTASAKIMNQHAAAGALDRMVEVNRSLDAALHDPELVAEVTALKGTSGDVFAKFYGQLEQLRAYHQRFPFVPLVRARVPGQEGDGEAKEGEEQTEAALPEVSFSGTESHGRHLDLHPFFDAYLNLTFVKAKREKDPAFELTYRAYVGSFYKFSSGVEARYKDEEYLHYVLDLQAYLVDFLRRAQPLLDVRKTLESIANDTQAKWDDGSLRSWGDVAAEDALYCAPCAKQFTKQSVFDGHLSGKKHIGAAKKWEADKATREVLEKKVFFEEVKVNRLVTDALSDVLEASVAEIEKKQARTLREQIEAMDHDSADDVLEEEVNKDDEQEEEQGFVKQIRNYPVGWDGEPIPYWLYRLHGLGVEYKCEICGNTSYWGRRAFEKHFEEYKHQNGLKLLGIPNVPAFFDVVRIKDAIELNKKLNAEEKSKAWDPDEMMEMEDDQGRVYDRKTYELLKKQGVIKAKH